MKEVRAGGYKFIMKTSIFLTSLTRDKFHIHQLYVHPTRL